MHDSQGNAAADSQEGPRRNVNRREELLRDLAEVSASILIKEGLTNEEGAARIGGELADWLSTYWGGQAIYIPRNWRPVLEARDKEIFSRMQTGNADDLACEYGMSRVRVYQIVRRVREEMQALANQQRRLEKQEERGRQVREAVGAVVVRKIGQPGSGSVPSASHPWRNAPINPEN